MKSWGRYELVAAPADADLVFELRFAAPLTDCGDKMAANYARQLDLAILDARPVETISVPALTSVFRNAVSMGAAPKLSLMLRRSWPSPTTISFRSEEHTSELQSLRHLVC